MRIRNFWNVENAKGDDRWQALVLFCKDVYNILNKGFTLSDNAKGTLLEIVIPAANTNVQVRHGLDIVPQNYILVGSLAATSVYDGTQANDKTYFNIRSSVATTVRLFIF